MSDGEVRTTAATLQRGSKLARWLRAPMHWLRDVPIADPVDRRNAPMLQLISALLAVMPALAWAYRAFAMDVPWRPGELTSMTMGLSVCAVAALAFVLIRLGRFTWATRVLLAVFAITLMPAYLSTGFGAQRFEQPVLVIWMAVAGLVVGRAALWLMFATIALAFAAGAWVDVSRTQDVDIYVDAISSAVMFLLIAIVLDRSASALRRSLGEANQRAEQLTAANAQLHLAMRERERTQEQLIHAQKLEAVGRLAGGAAHDFGNLMSVISGYVRRGNRAHSLEELRDVLAGVDAAARRATLLTHKLLALARPDAHQPESFDAAVALRELQPLLRQLFNPDVRIDWQLDTDLPAVHMDRDRFELMVLNLAANADHAMPGGGVFSVHASAHEAGVLLGFIDTGSGMPAEVQARMFEPFFTTKPKGQGTGLGLSVVRDVVHEAGGRIAADSQPGMGTAIRVQLPAQR